jgi:acyl-CoA dehydrogenase
MLPRDYLEWPFFEPRHRELALAAHAWAAKHIDTSHPVDVDVACRTLVRQLGDAGWLAHAIGGVQYGAIAEEIDTRAVCIVREALAEYSGLADFSFGMQGLGSGAITLFGSDAQKRAYLPRVANGSAIAAFALSELDAGSDAAALQCSARLDGDGYVLNGEKMWVSNGGIASFYVVFARTGDAPGAKGISAFVVDADAPGLEMGERIDVIAPHPLARLSFTNCRVPASAAPWRMPRARASPIAMAHARRVPHVSVAAAAVGLARRAFDAGDAARDARASMFGGVLGRLCSSRRRSWRNDGDRPSTAAALLTYRAAWLRDLGRIA